MTLLERKQLEKDVFKALNEAIKKRKTPIYTISAYDIDYDAVYEEVKYDGQIYYSEEEAVEAAREWCSELTSDDEPLICITVYGGEYKTPDGNFYGEPFDIWTISNKSKEETVIGRRNAGYVSEEVDEYAL